MATPTATRDNEGKVHFRRELDGTANELWQWFADSEKTAQWIGPFSGDPATGEVALTMTAEESGPPMPVTIKKCVPDEQLVVDAGMWVPEMRVEDGAIELLHAIEDAEGAASIGPGWEFYMDRLAVAYRGEDVVAVDLETDYYPVMSDYFTALYGRVARKAR